MLQNKKGLLATIFLTVLIDLMGVCIVIPISAPLLLNADATLLPSGMSMQLKTIVLGLLLSSFPLAQFFGAPMLGSLSDQYGRKRVLTYAIVGSLLGYLIFAYGIYTQNIYLLFCGRILDGFTGGNIAIINAAIADISSPEEKSKNFALVGAAFGLGMIFGPVIGGVLSNEQIHPAFHFYTPYLVAAGLCLLNIVLVQKYFVETLHQMTPAKLSFFTGVKNLKEGFSDVNLRPIFLSAFFYAYGFNVYTQYFQVYMYQKHHLNQTEIAYYFTWVGICITISQAFVARKLNTMRPPEWMIKRAMILTAGALFCMIIPQNPINIAWITPFIAIGQGLTYPNLTNLISKNALQGKQGKTLGIQHSIYACTMILAPISGSLVNAYHLDFPIVLSSFLIGCAWLFFTFTTKE